MQFGLRQTAVAGRDLYQNILRRLFGILDEHIEVAVVVEDTGVEKLILHLGATAAPVGLHQVGVGKSRLRVLVEKLHVGVGRRRVEVEVVLFDVLAVVGFAVGQAKKALFENRVLAVPQRQRKTEPLVVVGKTGQTVLAPAIGA